MDKQLIPDSFYQDEVVGLLANRYHTDPKSIVRSFLAQSDCLTATGTEPPKAILEENEMQILKDLLKYTSKQNCE